MNALEFDWLNLFLEVKKPKNWILISSLFCSYKIMFGCWANYGYICVHFGINESTLQNFVVIMTNKWIAFGLFFSLILMLFLKGNVAFSLFTSLDVVRMKNFIWFLICTYRPALTQMNQITSNIICCYNSLCMANRIQI